MTPNDLQSLEIDMVSLREEVRSLKSLVTLLSDNIYSYKSAFEPMSRRLMECEVKANHAGSAYHAELKHLTNKVYSMWYEMHPEHLEADDF